MALIKCPECRQDISDKATSCPSCGFPLEASRHVPRGEFNWPRTLRTLALWALLILGSIALVQFAGSRRQDAPEISYSAFARELDQSNVTAVEISGHERVRGAFRTAVTVNGRTSQHFTTLLPFEASDAWVGTLRDKGVEVRAREEQQSFGVFLFSFLPYLLIFGLLVFMIRRHSGERMR